jgi:predicted ATPase
MDLERAGYPVVHEIARDLIQSELAQGRTLDQIRSDKNSFENKILDAKIAAEAKLVKDELIFFDRGIPDSIAYFKIAGLDPGPAIAKSPANHYRKIFLLDPLPFKKDQVRIEEKATAAILDRALEKSYTMLGYKVMRIAVMPRQERIRTVLEALGIKKARAKDHGSASMR